MKKKTNRFSVKEFNDNHITIEEERKKRSKLSLFFINNGKLIFAISFLFSITVFLIAFYFIVTNIEDSSVVMYESNGVKVSFDKSDTSMLNGTPITESYAKKLFENNVNYDSSVGVVIEVKRKVLKDSNSKERIIIYYSDGTVLIKYDDGSYTKVSSNDGSYGVNEDGVINGNASIKNLSGRLEENTNLGISILYLSDGSIEVTKDNTVFLVRNSDITNNDDYLYGNMSGVSLPVNKDNGKVYYSDGTIKDNNGIIVNNIRYESSNKVNVYDNIKIIYYENGYAEIVGDNFSVMVQNANHIVYDENNLEIVNNINYKVELNNIMDIKEIELNNTNKENAHYIIVLEETSDYQKHKVVKRLDNNLIKFNVDVNGYKTYNNILNNNLKGSSLLEGINLKNNTYLLYEGTIEKLSSINIKLGLWIDYVEDRINNEDMNSAFIGTVRVYIESLS